jgi:outer membrane protein OmpA-like peptidoglycan-associated protein
MKRAVMVMILLVLGSGISFAFETGGRTAIGLKGGMQMYQGDINDQRFKIYGDLSCYGWVSDYWGLKLRGGAGILEAKDDFNNFWSWTYTFGPMLMFKPFPKNPLNFYLTAGFEMMQIDPRYISDHNLKLPNNLSGTYNHLQWAIPVGLGFSIFTSDFVSIDLEGLYHQAGSDYVDDLKTGKWIDSFVSASLGLSIYLTGPPDEDGDGIIDKLDKDPYHPEDFDGFQDADGAPDYDNDNDGVPDIRDKCPGTDKTVAEGINTKEDVDGFQDNDGCPDPDNDGDGIPDIDDKCPGTDQTVADSVNTKEDMDGFQDSDGCPDPDNDGDGIPDINDKCPGTDQTVADGIDTKETINGYQDDDGCPDKKPEIEVEKGKSIVLEGVYFASGSAQLEPNSMVILDKVYRTMLDNPELEVEIRGYTDNTGKYDRNVKLSKNRAESVKNYLVSKGIATYRILTKGFGPEDPIAPNSTKEGRAKNRRIEFFRIK